jgi:hypothetical protein
MHIENTAGCKEKGGFVTQQAQIRPFCIAASIEEGEFFTQ